MEIQVTLSPYIHENQIRTILNITKRKTNGQGYLMRLDLGPSTITKTPF